jgi:hypothetical protein
VRFIRVTQEAFVFQFSTREKRLLLELLELYPQVPLAHKAISKGSQLPDQATTQRLLNEALAEQRSQNKRQLKALVSNPRTWKPEDGHWLLTLAKTDLEWILQVLNDIRVGSWIQLGSPEAVSLTVPPESAPHLWAMELAGAFQMAFLHTLEGDGAGTA